MANLNKVILIGRLTATPELKQTASGLNVTSFSIAVNRRFAKPGEANNADFIDIVCWRQQAEFVCKYFTKGNPICIVGSIQTRNWQDKDGKNRKTTEVVADEVQFVESKKDGGGFRSNDGEPAFQSSDFSDFKELGDEDELPF